MMEDTASKPHRPGVLEGTSAELARERFGTPAAAERYARSLVGTRKDRRERSRIARCLAGVARGSRVLDVPCGTGRLLPFLCGLGYRVCGADSSEHMVARARRFAADHGLEDVELRAASVFDMPYADGAFDAVVCNRLLHHFAEPQTRRRALLELKRISRGPIVVSFFRNRTFGALRFRLKWLLRRRRPVDRIPISLRAFRADVEAAGLVVRKAMGVRPLISTQWYAVLSRPSCPPA